MFSPINQPQYLNFSSQKLPIRENKKIPETPGLREFLRFFILLQSFLSIVIMSAAGGNYYTVALLLIHIFLSSHNNLIRPAPLSDHALRDLRYRSLCL